MIIIQMIVLIIPYQFPRFTHSLFYRSVGVIDVLLATQLKYLKYYIKQISANK